MTLRLFSLKSFSAISDSHFLSFEWPMKAVLFLEFTGTEPADTVISAVHLSSGKFSGFSCHSLVTGLACDLRLLAKQLSAVSETREGGQKTSILSSTCCWLCGLRQTVQPLWAQLSQ